MKLVTFYFVLISALSIVHFRSITSASNFELTLPKSQDNEDVVPDMIKPEESDEILSTIANTDHIDATEIPTSAFIDTKNCGIYDTCEECYRNQCVWIQCLEISSTCSDLPDYLCSRVQCDNTTTTTVPQNVTTTMDPSNVTTTTDNPSTTTTVPTTTFPDTTDDPSNETTTVSPITTIEPTTTTPTTQPSPTTPPPVPHGRHFDAGSFFGGVILAATLFIGGFFAFKYYKRRSQALNYSNF